MITRADSIQLKLCEAIEDVLRKTPEIIADGAVVFTEDKFDPATKVGQASNTKLRIMISSTGHARRNGTGKSTAGDVSIEVVVFENPSRRTSNSTALTVTRAAEIIASRLHWQTFDGFDRLRYIDMARADADDHDYRMIVTFAACVALDPSKAVSWGIGEDIHLGEVTSKTVARGGTVVIEDDRRGNASRIGVRDRHWTIELSADVYEEISEDDLPDFGETFAYGGKIYTTTSASLLGSVEDTTTVRLAGRTIKGE